MHGSATQGGDERPETRTCCSDSTGESSSDHEREPAGGPAAEKVSFRTSACDRFHQ